MADGEALAGAHELASAIGKCAPLAVTAGKRVVVESSQWPVADAFTRQSEVLDPCLHPRMLKRVRAPSGTNGSRCGRGDDGREIRCGTTAGPRRHPDRLVVRARPHTARGVLLSDLGADVIRIDRPDGAPEVSGLGSADDPRTRGQRTIGIDLKNPRGCTSRGDCSRPPTYSSRGCAQARPSASRSGQTDLRGLNPKLVYARMTGWGQSGANASLAGHDINYIAAAGALHPIGPASEPPAVPLNLVGDFGGGSLYLVAAILAALIQRSTTERGQVIDCAMVDGAASLTTLFHGMMAAGIWSQNREDNLFDGAAPFYRTYRTADDRFVAVGALEPKFYAAFIDRAGYGSHRLASARQVTLAG